MNYRIFFSAIAVLFDTLWLYYIIYTHILCLLPLMMKVSAGALGQICYIYRERASSRV